MEIQVGEYIRTTDGIKKIIKVNEGSNATYYGKYIVFPEYKNSKSINVKNILKHDFDIRKLIEEGDYVNGDEVVKKEKHWLVTSYNVIREDHIKSIVTKEQFKAMEYVIEEG